MKDLPNRKGSFSQVKCSTCETEVSNEEHVALHAHRNCESALYKAYYEFLEDFPSYEKTMILDEFRDIEYGRLDECGQIYLDYTGSGLYGKSQIDAYFKLLQKGCLGNPHSQNPTSIAMSKLVEDARDYVFKFFNADPEIYDVIFTPNASGALKTVGEAFPFTEASRYLLLADNHNSVNGIREFAKSKGAKVTYTKPKLPDLRIDPAELRAELGQVDTGANNLFAYPAQSNFTGVQHDLSWIAEAQALGWHVLLDAAAFVPSNRLDLSVVKPDFVPVSFYKIFGFPTGIGALLIKRAAYAKLQRPWFAGGTISITTTLGKGNHYLHEDHSAYEDGTINFLSIPLVKIGLRHIERAGLDLVHERVVSLTGWLLKQMQLITHSNGTNLVRIQGPSNMVNHGGNIAFSVQDPDEAMYDFRVVERLANSKGISLRTGCFCNPGCGEIVHGLTDEEMVQAFSFDRPVGFCEFVDMAAEKWNKFPSSIRVSTGIASNFRDVYYLMAFLEELLERPAAEVNAIPIERTEYPDTA